MLNKKNIVVLTLAAVAAVLLLASSSAQSGAQASKLEGVWTASVPGTPFHWTYTFAPTDPSGRKAVLHGEFVVPVPAAAWGAPTSEYLSSFFGEGAMTGPDSVTVTVMWYGMRTGADGRPEIIYIGISVSEGKFLGPNKVEVQHRLAYYAPTPTGQVTPEDEPLGVSPIVTSIDQRMSAIPVTGVSQ